MIPGLSYIVSSAVIAALLSFGRGRGIETRPSTIFQYSRPIRIALLLCIPVWICAAVIVRWTARPGADAEIASYFSDGFLLFAVASATLYVYSKRFFIEIEEEALQWRELFSIYRMGFREIDKVSLKNLNNGSAQISIYRNGKRILKLSGIIEGSSELRSLLELRSKKFSIPIDRS